MDGHPCAKTNRFQYFLLSFLWVVCFLVFIPKTKAQLLPLSSEGEWHVLFIAATSDPIAGEANAYSLQQATEKLQVFANLMGVSLHTYRITGEAFTTEGVKQGIRKLINIPHPKQGKLMGTVMSFTHGVNFNDTWTQLPFMVCHPTEYRVTDQQHLIALEDIYHSLRTFGAFDHLHVWAELCNNIPYGLEERAPDAQAFFDLKNNLQFGEKGTRLRQLLMQNHATLMISATYGQMSYAFKDAGGLFSYSLLEGLEQVSLGRTPPHFDGNDGLFAFVKQCTAQAIKNLAGNMRQQTPIGYIGDIPRDIPMPASNIIRTSDGMMMSKKPIAKPQKTPLDMLKEVWGN